MPLIVCADCRRSISDAAPACIYCGRPVGTNKPTPSTAKESLISEKEEARPSTPMVDQEVTSRGPNKKSRTTTEWLGGLLGFGAMYLFLHLPVDSLALKMLAGGVVGLLIGLIPHAQAKKRGANALAIWSIVACTVGGALSGVLLAIPLCVALTWYARRKAPT